MTINVLLVDDEPLAREGLALRLAQYQDINVLGECGNGKDAIQFILDKKPDLVFLDIKMPKVSGFDVVKAIGSEMMPMVIFLTAYDEFAVEAFKVNALDYLLKPINKNLFEESINRAREELLKCKVAERSKQLSDLLMDIDKQALPLVQQPAEKTNERLVVRSHGHVYFVRPEDIQWIEADGDYINIHTAKRTHLVRETMRSMEKRLENYGFQRIHRSVIVKLSLVSELIAVDSGEYEVVINDGKQLKLSRSYRDILFEKMQSDI